MAVAVAVDMAVSGKAAAAVVVGIAAAGEVGGAVADRVAAADRAVAEQAALTVAAVPLVPLLLLEPYYWLDSSRLRHQAVQKRHLSLHTSPHRRHHRHLWRVGSPKAR